MTGNSQKLTLAVICAALVVVISQAWSGPLDPPAGPVSPTMRTLDEIYEAVTRDGQRGQTRAFAVISGIPGDVSIPDFGNAIEVIDGGIMATNEPSSVYHYTSEYVLGVRKGRGSPALLELAAKEHTTAPTVPLVEIRLYREDEGGLTHYFTVKLTDVVLRRMYGVAPNAAGTGSNNRYTEGLGTPGFIDTDWLAFFSNGWHVGKLTYTSVPDGETRTTFFGE